MIGCLCVHGFTGGVYEIKPLAEYLSENTDWMVKTPELPGHGERLSLEGSSYKEWISGIENSFIDLKNQCDKIYLIGFSMGGMITSYLAAKYKVSKLVLLSASGKYLSYKQWIKDTGEMLVDGLHGDVKDNNLVNGYKSKAGTVPWKALWEFIKCVQFTKPYLGLVSCPVLIAHGKRDRMVPYETAYYLEKKIASRDKKVVFFDQSRHLICLGEEKDVLCNIVYTFLTRR